MGARWVAESAVDARWMYQQHTLPSFPHTDIHKLPKNNQCETINQIQTAWLKLPTYLYFNIHYAAYAMLRMLRYAMHHITAYSPFRPPQVHTYIHT